MITRVALALAGYFADKGIYEKEKINIYKYGFELLLSTFINMLCILLIAILMRSVVGAVFFCMAFIPLRLSAGGYHAKHHWSCILGFNIIFLGFAALHHYMSMEYTQHYSLATVIISSLLVWSLAPVEAVNKPLKDEQKGKQRKRSIIIVSINIAVTLLFYAVNAIVEYTPFLAFYNSGALAASFSLVVAMIANRKAERMPML